MKGFSMVGEVEAESMVLCRHLPLNASFWTIPAIREEKREGLLLPFSSQ